METSSARTYEQLSAQMLGIENLMTQMVGQVTTTLRKEIRAVEDRLSRQIQSDRKEEAAELHKVKANLTKQISEDVAAAEERIYRRMQSERMKHKEMIAELRRETSSQIAAQQDTASFTTQRVVPKETEEMAALRAAMEDIRTVAENSKKDVKRLAQDLADQKHVCDGIQISIQNLPKHNEEMLALKLAVEKAENMAQQAKKLAEKDVTLGMESQRILASTVGDMDADIRADMRRQMAKVQSDMMLEMNKRLEDTQQIRELEVSQRGITNIDSLESLEKKLKKLEDANLELRLAKLEGVAQRAANYSDAGDATLFTTSRRPLGENKLTVSEEKISDMPLTREERREERERKSRERRLSMDPRTDSQLESLLSLMSQGKNAYKDYKGQGEIHEPQPLVSDDLKSRLESLVEQVKETLSGVNVTSLLEPKYDESYGAQPIAEPEEAEYYDGNYQGDYVQNDGFDELDGPVEGYEEMAQMDGANYGGHGHIPNGQMMPMPNGQMHGQMPGQMLHYQPQGIQSEGQMHFTQYDQQYAEPQYMPQQVVAQAPVAPIAQPLQHFVQHQMAPVAQSHARYCGSIALPISREPDRYSEQEHRMDAMSELGMAAQMGQSMYAQPSNADYGMMGSLDGETYACDNGGGYEAVFENQTGYIDVPQVPFTSVSYGPPTVVGVGAPVVHSVTTRVGRPVSPVREHSPVRGRGASPVRGASPIRGAPVTGNPRHRELSPFRARSVGDPPSFSFQPGGLVSNVSPVPVNVMTSGATASPGMIPPATIKEDPPKEEEDSSSDEEEEKPSAGATILGRLFHGSA